MTKRNNEEHRIQCGIVEWYDLVVGDGMLFAIPNGGARDHITGAMLKREGVRAGVWDMFLARPKLVVGQVLFHGLWIEVRVPERRQQIGGGLTRQQHQFEQNAITNGYATEVVYTTQQGINVIQKYLAGR